MNTIVYRRVGSAAASLMLLMVAACGSAASPGPTLTPSTETGSPAPTPTPEASSAIPSRGSSFDLEAARQASEGLVDHIEMLDNAYWGATRSQRTQEGALVLLTWDLATIGVAGTPRSVEAEGWSNLLNTSLKVLKLAPMDPAAYETVRDEALPLILAVLNDEYGTNYQVPAKPSPEPHATAAITTASKAPPPKNSFSFAGTGKATFEYFTVDLGPATIKENGVGAFHAEVCVLKPADPNPDGTTRVSTNPWGVVNNSGVTLTVRSSSLSPGYPDVSRLNVGDCVTGWLEPTEASDIMTVTYANSMGETATWSLTGTTASGAPVESVAPQVVNTSAYDLDWAKQILAWVVDDIERADEYVLDGLSAHLAMDSLAEDMERLRELGAPPGVDDAQYFALTNTLVEFYGKAYQQLYPDPSTFDLIDGAATYAVARQGTQDLLDLVAPALGVSHVLPAWSFPG